MAVAPQPRLSRKQFHRPLPPAEDFLPVLQGGYRTTCASPAPPSDVLSGRCWRSRPWLYDNEWLEAKRVVPRGRMARGGPMPVEPPRGLAWRSTWTTTDHASAEAIVPRRRLASTWTLPHGWKSGQRPVTWFRPGEYWPKGRIARSQPPHPAMLEGYAWRSASWPQDEFSYAGIRRRVSRGWYPPAEALGGRGTHWRKTDVDPLVQLRRVAIGPVPVEWLGGSVHRALFHDADPRLAPWRWARNQAAFPADLLAGMAWRMPRPIEADPLIQRRRLAASVPPIEALGGAVVRNLAALTWEIGNPFLARRVAGGLDPVALPLGRAWRVRRVYDTEGQPVYVVPGRFLGCLMPPADLLAGQASRGALPVSTDGTSYDPADVANIREYLIQVDLGPFYVLKVEI